MAHQRVARTSFATPNHGRARSARPLLREAHAGVIGERGGILTAPTDTQLCTECGAAIPGGQTCEANLHALLAREWEVYAELDERMPDGDRELAHFLSVATYVLQHPTGMQYTEASLHTLREMVTLRLNREPLTFYLRQTARAVREEGLVRRRSGDPVPSWGAVTWSANVSWALGAPARDYVHAVRRWAEDAIRSLRDAG